MRVNQGDQAREKEGRNKGESNKEEIGAKGGMDLLMFDCDRGSREATQIIQCSAVQCSEYSAVLY